MLNKMSEATADAYLLSKMIEIAADAHKYQYDKAGKPYILHCLKVMDLLDTDDIELMCIAVGHDLIEDTEIDEETLRDFYNIPDRVVNGILCLTKVNGESYSDYKEKVKSNPDAVLVKIADLTHNTDVSRIKGVTQKDMDRTLKYYKFYLELVEIRSKMIILEI